MAIVAKYSLNGNSNDSAGTNNGTDTNINYVAGKNGSGASFNGSTSFIDIGNQLDEDGSNPFSISFLMKLNSNTQNQMLVGKQLGSGSFGGYMVWYQYSAGVTAWLNFSLISNDSTFGAIEITTPINLIDTGKYYFICATYNGSKNASGANIYINSVNSSVQTTNTLGTKSISTSANFNIGSRNNGGLPTNGTIDDVIKYNHVLSQSEIKNKYLFYNGFI